MLLGAGALGATAIAAACAPCETILAGPADISPADRLEISELYSRHFYSLDGLTAILGGEADQNWAETFTADGEFSMVRANGGVLALARGTEELVRIYATFHHTTRHWMNHLLILPDESGVRGSCYILGLDIKELPYKIIRTGIYEDQLVQVDAAWKFQARKLILDPSSPD
jgi:SnoaL-like domain